MSNAISIFRIICQLAQQMQASNEQLSALNHTIAQLLQTLDKEYRNQRLAQAQTSAQLDELDRCVVIRHIVLMFSRTLGPQSLLQEIARYVKKQSNENFLRLLLTKDRRIACIDGYHWRIVALVSAFQVRVQSFP